MSDDPLDHEIMDNGDKTIRMSTCGSCEELKQEIKDRQEVEASLTQWVAKDGETIDALNKQIQELREQLEKANHAWNVQRLKKEDLYKEIQQLEKEIQKLRQALGKIEKNHCHCWDSCPCDEKNKIAQEALKEDGK